MPVKKRDFLSISDLSVEEIHALFARTEELKKSRFLDAFKNKAVGLIFQKPSLRTRVSFQVGVWQLGGQCMSLSPAEVNIGVRESIKDAARTLSRYLDLIVARVFKHREVEELGQYSLVPVINGLSDSYHPCQALADIFTVKEKRGSVNGLTLVYLGDGNNVCNSLLQITSMLGMNMKVACPKGYAPNKEVLEFAQAQGKKTGATIMVTQDPKDAVRGADVLYTDVWASMGQEREAAKRAKIFKKYQINKELMGLAKNNALVMHCLPAHRGAEITDDCLDSPNSVVFDEAENRLHVQKAIMLKLAEGR
ncbi:MAG TPA: ornithine carbamoyltransferase [Candidatus Omnitrophica bacterium]|nr:ornithine carbamoyltransferase [Candidatus Omnitrophota bacterium]